MDRGFILSALEGIDTGSGSAEDLPEAEVFRALYPVPSQARVFNLDRIVILGGRGTGKTHIFRTLLHRQGREAVVQATGVKLIHDVGKMVLIEGFSAGRASSAEHPNHPSAEGIEETVGSGEIGDARRLWLGLCMARLSLAEDALRLLPEAMQAVIAPLRPQASSARSMRAWVDEDVERPFNILDALDRESARRGLACVFTFDALDRTANRWDKLSLLVGGLLSLSLDVFRRLRTVRFKVFLRPDLESDAAKSFPDASKLRGHQETLVWARSDLYRLAFKRMVAHAEHGDTMRAYLSEVAGTDGFVCIDPLGWVPTLRLDEEAQRRVMGRLVGPYMGANPQKGKTYEWIPNHLADTFRKVSPRSFLIALARAAESARQRPVPWKAPLSPSSLEEGVTAASGQRVEELKEDFPWIGEVGRRLEGLLVPCQSRDILVRLKQCELSGTHRGLRSAEPHSVLQQLIDLGVFMQLPDQRYNVPDLYRVAMNMKRRGGIRVAK